MDTNLSPRQSFKSSFAKTITQIYKDTSSPTDDFSYWLNDPEDTKPKPTVIPVVPDPPPRLQGCPAGDSRGEKAPDPNKMQELKHIQAIHNRWKAQVDHLQSELRKTNRGLQDSQQACQLAELAQLKLREKYQGCLMEKRALIRECDQQRRQLRKMQEELIKLNKCTQNDEQWRVQCKAVLMKLQRVLSQPPDPVEFESSYSSLSSGSSSSDQASSLQPSVNIKKPVCGPTHSTPAHHAETRSLAAQIQALLDERVTDVSRCTKVQSRNRSRSEGNLYRLSEMDAHPSRLREPRSLESTKPSQEEVWV